MALVIPNEASNPAQSGIYSTDLQIISQGLNQEGVISGCLVSQRGAGANMSVDVAVGQVTVSGFYPYLAATATLNVVITAAPASLSRIDLISVDQNGACVATAGTAANIPMPPAVTANAVAIAYVFVAPNVTSILTANIIDKRVIVINAFRMQSDFIEGSIESGEIGGMNWQMVGAPAQQTAIASRPGVLQMSTTSIINNVTSLYAGTATTTLPVIATDVARLRYVVSIPTITTVECMSGLATTWAAPAVGALGTAGVWIEFSTAASANLRAYTRNASVSSTVLDLGVAVVANTWYQLDIIRTGAGNWQFAVNNAYKGVISTALPTVAVNVGATMETLVAATRNFQIDFFGMDTIKIAQRWT